MNSANVQELFKESGWLKALTLGERASTLNGDDAWTTRGEAQANPRARKRFERWRSQAAFESDEQFASRLKSEGLTSSQLLYLLEDGDASLAERVGRRPDWLARLERAFSRPGRGAEEAAGEHGHDKGWRGMIGGLAGGLAPLIAEAVERVQAGVRRLQGEYAELPFEPEGVVALFMPSLLIKLNGHATRTLVLELNVARLREQLEGETPEERYAHFRRLMETPGFLLPILYEYPVLTRQLIRSLDYWETNTLEVLTRLCADWAEIKASFSPTAEPGRLQTVAGDAGDTHREGRSVKILNFESGFKVVYKPHTLSVDVHFGELLDWLNARGEHPPFRSLNVIDRQEYGWVEFVPAGACSTEEEVKRFYRRQGGLLALLYALEATDFHLENLIASGEHPVLIDLESLFHPRPKGGPQDSQGRSSALDALNNSVLRIGMLPQRIWAVGGSDGIDMSGMGGAAGQLTPFPVLTYENQATDQMKIVRKRLKMDGSQNRPTLGGQDVDLQNYKDEIVAGFTSVYRLLLRERESLLADDGPLSRFARDEVRAVLRPTRAYGTLLAESFHPDVLRDALEHDRLLDCLWDRANKRPEYAPVALAEIRDIQCGDVPMFTCRPDSLDLWTSRRERIPNFFAEGSLEGVRRRLRSLSEENLASQLWFISACLSSLTLGLGGTRAGYELAPRAGRAERTQFLDAARSIADRLEATALRDEASVNWIGLTLMGERNWTLLPLVDNLYDGTLGVALFLAYAGELLGEGRYTALAKTALDNARARFEQLKGEIESDGDNEAYKGLSVGGYGGLGSLVYVLAHAGSLWQDPALLSAAESCVEILPRYVERDETLDVINGSAGCILNLLALHRVTASARALEVAKACGERILSRAEEAGGGAAWSCPPEGQAPLTGFSHGAAGIACALLKLSEATGESRYAEAAFRAFDYERGLFSPEEENWPDLRADALSPEGVPSYMLAWCHGAPGIGLSRIQALPHEAAGPLADEIRAAAAATLRGRFDVNHSLCHGALGNAEFLHEAGVALADPALTEGAERLAASLLDSVVSVGPVCGTPDGTETPGLMTGLAGIGYGLLRAAEPGRVPSVLVLAPPPAAAGPGA